jgi:acetyl esterase
LRPGLCNLSELTVDQARAQERAALRLRDVELEPVDVVSELAIPVPTGSIPSRMYLPGRRDRPAPVLVWFPGGGWVLGSLEAADPVCRKLANETPCAVIATEYRRAPEHRFPAAVDDCWAATRWIAENARDLGLDPERIAVGGASVGGNLAAVVAHLARDRGAPALALQVLVYPPTDWRARGDVAVADRGGAALDRAGARWCWTHYLGDSSGDDPRASPLRAAEFEGLPPALVITAEDDPFREEGELYARKLAAGEVATEHVRYHAPHGFFSTPGPTASEAARENVVFALRRVFGEGVQGRAQ